MDSLRANLGRVFEAQVETTQQPKGAASPESTIAKLRQKCMQRPHPVSSSLKRAAFVGATGIIGIAILGTKEILKSTKAENHSNTEKTAANEKATLGEEKLRQAASRSTRRSLCDSLKVLKPQPEAPNTDLPSLIKGAKGTLYSQIAQLRGQIDDMEQDKKETAVKFNVVKSLATVPGQEIPEDVTQFIKQNAHSITDGNGKKLGDMDQQEQLNTLANLYEKRLVEIGKSEKQPQEQIQRKLSFIDLLSNEKALNKKIKENSKHEQAIAECKDMVKILHQSDVGSLQIMKDAEDLTKAMGYDAGNKIDNLKTMIQENYDKRLMIMENGIPFYFAIQDRGPEQAPDALKAATSIIKETKTAGATASFIKELHTELVKTEGLSQTEIDTLKKNRADAEQDGGAAYLKSALAMLARINSGAPPPD